MENTCKLLFELSSSERMRVLLELQKQQMKLSHISKKTEDDVHGDVTTVTATQRKQNISKSKE